MIMTHTEQVIANALALVEASRAARERDQQRRAAWQRKVELSRPLQPLPRPVQLPLALN
ncbi:hypothetical protein ELI02_29170 (plasmid) [Rhizobium leguminosarum]|nr:hypothetical protein ELI02_29170 [Rhizobium leguminosarum]TAX55616.1 hypothetical protein ELI01_10455 [Rhizobium leguminosarum]TAY01455.1 hypothetical protein ELH95_10185 [Rhizobium leguminosarum]TAY16973.1 hypothetical protein ELH91_09430 [Rhizobium leguminosarum]